MTDKTLPTLTTTTAAAVAGTTKMIVRRSGQTSDESMTFTELIDYLNDSLQLIDATLTALAAYNTNGLLTQTAADTFVGRTITGGIGVAVADGNGVAGNPTLAASANAQIRSIQCTIDGGASTPATGSKAFLTVPVACTLTNYYLAADASGSAVIDIKRSGASIVGAGNKPTLAAAQTANAALSGWTSVAVAAGDILEFNLDSVTTCKRINLVLKTTISS